LAHELKHAENNLDGDFDKSKVKVINNDIPSQGKVFETNQDELDVREFEQSIREEQGVIKRKDTKEIEER
jgi:hypothetical protein